jgi:ketosteroid isomerase-like protein
VLNQEWAVEVEVQDVEEVAEDAAEDAVVAVEIGNKNQKKEIL